MDYGKMAYLKTEELEAKLAQTAEARADVPCLHRVRVSGKGLLTLLPRNNGRYSAVTVKAKIIGGSGDVWLSLGGMRTDRASVDENKTECVLFGTGGGNVVLDTRGLDGETAEAECEILLPYTETAEYEPKLRFASLDEDYVICEIKDGDITLTCCDKRYNVKTVVKAGRGKCADVCRAGDGYCLVYTDMFDRLWSAVLDRQLNVLSRNCLGESVGSLSVTCRKNRIYAFYARDGNLCCFSFDAKEGTRGREFRPLDKQHTDRAAAVKNAEPLAVIVSSGGKNLLLKEEPEAAKTIEFSVTATGRAQNV